MNSRKVHTMIFRLLFSKFSLQRNVSKFTKLDNCSTFSISFTGRLNKCCSSHVQNASENREEFEVKSSLFDNIDVEAITDNDSDKIASLEILLTKLQTNSERGFISLPKIVSIRQWREIISLPTITQKMKYFEFIKMTEARKEEKKKKKLEKRKLYEVFLKKKKSQPKQILTTNSLPVYGLSHTSLFQRLRDKDIEKFYNYKLLDPLVYGPDIVFDCEYSSFMTRREIHSAAFQVGGAWRMNRSNVKPFNVVYANLSKGSLLYERLKLMYPLLDEDPSYPFIYTPKSFMDLYPKEQLIYLSPHAVETMETYEPDKVYIIGCMVDLVMPEPLSLAKAKKFNIRTMKFPLNKYLNWKAGGKALNMDHCIKIMLDIKNGHDWQSTLLRHIPTRKLEITQLEKGEEKENHLQDARAIRRMYLKNKVHELIVDEEKKKGTFVNCK